MEKKKIETLKKNIESIDNKRELVDQELNEAYFNYGKKHFEGRFFKFCTQTGHTTYKHVKKVFLENKCVSAYGLIIRISPHTVFVGMQHSPMVDIINKSTEVTKEVFNKKIDEAKLFISTAKVD